MPPWRLSLVQYVAKQSLFSPSCSISPSVIFGTYRRISSPRPHSHFLKSFLSLITKEDPCNKTRAWIRQRETDWQALRRKAETKTRFKQQLIDRELCLDQHKPCLTTKRSSTTEEGYSTKVALELWVRIGFPMRKVKSYPESRGNFILVLWKGSMGNGKEKKRGYNFN